MRIVLDTNVLVRAVPGSNSPAREVFERIAVAPHVLVLSEPLLAELADVLNREHIRTLHGLGESATAQLLKEVESAAFVVPVVTGVTAVKDDPDDNAVIATAIDGHAEVICTRDRHFRNADVQAFCSNRGIHIMTDLELLDSLRQVDADDEQ